MENGTCYKFIVSSAEEAAALIREKLGPDARVLSVRNIDKAGIRGLFAKPKLEVIAQIVTPAADDAQAGADGASGADEEEKDQFISHGPSQPAEAMTNAAGGAPAETRALAGARSPTMGTARFAPAAKKDLSTLLRKSGLSEMALGRLQAAPFWNEVNEQPLHRGLVDIGIQIRRMAEAKWSGAGLRRAAFLGTAGSGRTTALCKWLGLEVFRRARAGHVVTAEFDRPNAPGALPVFSEALGIPVARYPASTEPATPGGFVYLDLPGMSLRDPSANQPISRFLDEHRIRERVLVLNAAYDHATLRSAYGVARDLGATHVVFTHLDEVPQWGRLWDYLLDGSLEPLFLGTGPSLTGDCEEDVFGALVRRTLAPDPAESFTPRAAAALHA